MQPATHSRNSFVADLSHKHKHKHKHKLGIRIEEVVEAYLQLP